MVVVVVFPILVDGSGRASSSSSSSTTTLMESQSTSSSSKQLLSSASSSPLQQQHVLLYETEVESYDENDGKSTTSSWKGAWPSRWTTVTSGNNKVCPSSPPTHVKPPPNMRWNGEWKIVMDSLDNSSTSSDTCNAAISSSSSSSCDALGWHYYYDTNTNETTTRRFRRRTWLRSITPITSSTSTSTSTTTTSVVPSNNNNNKINNVDKLSFATTTTTTTTNVCSQQQQRQRQKEQNRQLPSLFIGTKTKNMNVVLFGRRLFLVLKENWNFKGMGMSLYKSLVSWSSVGISIRLPLSSNVEWWERHFVLPTISSSIGMYYPSCTIGIFVSISLNVDYIQWCTSRTCQQIKIWCRTIVVTALRYLLILLTVPMDWILRLLLRMSSSYSYVLSYNNKRKTNSNNNDDDTTTIDTPTTRTTTTTATTTRSTVTRVVQQWLANQRGSTTTLLSSTAAAPSSSLPLRNVDISERIGMSLSWRISKKRGYEFRCSYWHSYLPTVLYLHSLLVLQQATQQQAKQGLGGTTTTATSLSSQSSQEQEAVPSYLRLLRNDPLRHKVRRLLTLPPTLEYWLRRRTGSLGISTSGPTPDPPYMSCSACLSLSGFHYQQRRRRPPTTTTTSSSSSSPTRRNRRRRGGVMLANNDDDETSIQNKRGTAGLNRIQQEERNDNDDDEQLMEEGTVVASTTTTKVATS